MTLLWLQQTAHQIAQHHAHSGQHDSSPFMRWIVHLGGLGLLLVSFMDGWVVPLPIPGSTDLLLLLLVVRHGNPWLLVPITLVGTLLGGYLTWRIGKTGGEAALRRFVPRRILGPVECWVKANGFLAVAIATVLPPPVPLTPITLASGALGVERNRFLLAFAIGRAVRYSLVGWLGVMYGRALVHAWRHYLASYAGEIGWTIAAISLAGIAFGLYKFVKMRDTAAEAPALETKAA